MENKQLEKYKANSLGFLLSGPWSPQGKMVQKKDCCRVAKEVYLCFPDLSSVIKTRLRHREKRSSTKLYSSSTEAQSCWILRVVSV